VAGAVYLYGGGFSYDGKAYSNSVLVGFEIYFMKEWCSLEEVYDAYIECRKRKRSTKPCAKFEQNEMSNVY